MPKATPEQLDEFGARLNEWLMERQMSRRALADLLGITTQAVDNYANGKREPDPRTVALMEGVLESGGSLAQALGYGATVNLSTTGEAPLEISASGVDLDELKALDPEAYDLIVRQAELALDRARERREQG